MLIDALAQGALYPFGSAWSAVFRDLQALAARGDELPEGSYPLAGGPDHGGATATVGVYAPRDEAEGRYETHDVMADIQIVLAGEEDVRITAREGLTPAGVYDPARDITFYRETPAGAARVRLSPGLFLFVLPHDAHMPSLATGMPGRVKKLVAKLPVSLLSLA